MAVRQPPRVIAASRLRRLRECAVEDWVIHGGHLRDFDAAWPRIQAHLLPRGASSPGVAGPKAIETIRGAIAALRREYV